VSDICERAGLGAVEFVTARKFLNEWLASKAITKSKGTLNKYKPIAEAFLAHLDKRADMSLAAIQPRDVQSFRDKQVKDGKSPSTANSVVKTLRIPFNLARRQGLILSNPAEAVDLLTADRNERGTFTRQQIKSLLQAADCEWRGMVLLGVCHGLRLGDAARLTWDNVNAERRSLILYPQKTSHSAKPRGRKRDQDEAFRSQVRSPRTLYSPRTRNFARRIGKGALFPACEHRLSARCGAIAVEETEFEWVVIRCAFRFLRYTYRCRDRLELGPCWLRLPSQTSQ
jgi:integrase